MKLLNKTIENDFSKTGSQDGLGDEAKVIVKYFNPTGAGTWLITELQEYRLFKDGKHEVAYTLEEKEKMVSEGWELYDTILFGLCTIHEQEWGTVSLRELEDFTGQFGLRIERDLHASGMKIKELKR